MFSTKQRQVGDFEYIETEKCKICSQHCEQISFGVQRYFLIIGIPFFPLRREVIKTCIHCRTMKRSRYRENTSDLPFEVKGLFFPPNSRLRYFTGTILLLLMTLLLLYIIL